MMDVMVKTLDGQNKNYSLPENITVKEFKERIANSIGIAADTQRLIFHGRVMQDEKLLKDYDVHGKVIHVVHRPPPSSRTQTSSTETPPSRGNSGIPHMNNVVVGSFTLPSDILDPNQVQNIVQQAVSDMGEDWRNAHVSARTSTDGSSVDVHINLGQVPSNPIVDSEGQMQLNRARQMLGLAREAVYRLEHPPGSGGSDQAEVEEDEEDVELDEEESEEASAPDTATDQSPPTTASQNNNSAPDSASPMETSPDAANSSATSQQTPAASSSERRDPRTTGQSESRSNTSSSTSAGAGDGNPNRINRPAFSSLADYIEEAESVNTRLQPFLGQLRDVARRDPQLTGDEVHENQRLFNLVSEALHAIGHSYHSASDLMVNISQPPPRYMSASPAVARMGPPLLHGLPPHGIPVGPQVPTGAPTFIHIPTTTPAASTQASNGNASSATRSSSATTTSTATTTASSVAGQFPDMASVTASSSPYLFVEVGPETVTVNSISAHVIATRRPDQEEASSTTTTTTTTAPPPPTTTSSSQPSSTLPQSTPTTQTASSQPAPPPQPQQAANGTGPQQIHGMPQIPGLLSDVMQNIISSVLQTHGHRPGQPVQVNVVPIPVPASRAGGLPAAMSISRVVNTSAGATAQQSSANGQTTASATSTVTTPSTATTAQRAAGTQTTSSSTSASTATTQTHSNSQPRPVFIGPGLLPGDAMPGFIPQMRSHIDPFLPCTSRHFLTQRTRNLAQNQQNPEHMLADMVGNLMTGIIGHGIPPAGTGPRPAAAPSTTSTSSAAGTRAPPGGATPRATTQTTPSQPGPIPANPFASLLAGTFGGIPGVTISQSTGVPPAGTPGQPNVFQMLQSMLQTGAASTTASRQTSTTSTSTTSSSRPTSTSSSTTASGPPRPSAMSDEFFTQLVGGIGRYMGQAASGRETNDTVSQFLNSFGDQYNIQPGQGFLNDIFHCLSQHMTFSDMFGVFFGQPGSLNHLRQPLQDFVRHRCLHDMEPTEANFSKATDDLVEEITSEFVEAVATVEVKQDIDLVETLKKLFRHHFLNLQKLIIESKADDETFGQRLYEGTRRLLAEFVMLTPSCLVGGMPAFETMMQSRLRHMTTDMNPMIQQWMVSMTSQQIQSFVRHVTTTESDVSHYIVRRTSQPARESPMETSPPVPKPTTTTGATAATKKTNGPERPKLNSITPSALHSERVKRPYMNGATSDGQSPSHSESPMSPDMEDESWQSVVPADWVPVINNDIARQKESKSQHPHSDAYLHGMPPKRRKMMTADRPPNSLTNMSQYMPESVRRAATVVGVQPISSLENMTNEASEEGDLHNALEGEIQRVIFERLQRDSDYDSTRFPHARAYYQNKSNKK
ncbi:large proline-rich protein BAG6-like [Gigantopelta aegis]|uniref:large proline-rich protein BAG6-like n=1 Tax=Gigantopelta aegis TaxID=1735272 RepID=UPI001B88786E|nr:large proline-rich protein BAG6-like [Gigantopelta aegis]XP_041370735.1 large proline-rich protein BAG6-like [Gigantopelta aegis]